MFGLLLAENLAGHAPGHMRNRTPSRLAVRLRAPLRIRLREVFDASTARKTARNVPGPSQTACKLHASKSRPSGADLDALSHQTRLSPAAQDECARRVS